MNIDALVSSEIELLDLIFGLNPLAWRRYQQHGLGSGNARGSDEPKTVMWCPFVAFRFALEDASVTKRLREAVDAFRGILTWSLFGHEREGLPGTNWAIGPAILFEVKERAAASRISAGEYLSRKDPSLVSAACHEFPLLVGHVRLCTSA